MPQQIIKADNINLRRNDVHILKNVSWEVREDENWGLVGLNGSGKTSLLRCVTGDFWPTTGDLWLFGGQLGKIDLPQYKKKIGWVGGAIDKWLPPSETALRLVITGLHHTYEIYRQPTADEIDQAMAVLENIGCQYLHNRPFSKLSQGEKQKIRLARSLIAKPQLLILDEVCAGLDIKSRENLLDTIEQMKVPSIMFVTHHIEEIPVITDNIIAMKDGKVHSCGAKQDILRGEILSEIYDVNISVSSDEYGRYWSRAVK